MLNVPLHFLPRDATQSSVMPQYVVCLSVCLSVCDVQVPWSHRLEYFENNFTAEELKAYARADPNIGDLVQCERLPNCQRQNVVNDSSF